MKNHLLGLIVILGSVAHGGGVLIDVPRMRGVPVNDLDRLLEFSDCIRKGIAQFNERNERTRNVVESFHRDKETFRIDLAALVPKAQYFPSDIDPNTVLEKADGLEIEATRIVQRNYETQTDETVSVKCRIKSTKN